MKQNERNLKRVLVYYPAMLHKEKSSQHALIKDLSTSGAKVVIKGKIPHKFNLEFSPVPGTRPLKLLCHVQWKNEYDECGVKFSKTSNLEKKVLSSLVKYHRLEE